MGDMTDNKPIKSKKPIIIILILLITAVILTICGMLYYYNLPSTKFNRQLSLGNKYLLAQDYENAIKAFNTALEIEPKSRDAVKGLIKSYTGSGEQYEKAGKDEMALAAYQKVIDIQADDLEMYQRIALLYEKQGDYDQAIAWMEKGIEAIGSENISKEYADILVGYYKKKAEDAEAQGELDTEILQYKKILAIEPDNSEISNKQKEKTEISPYQQQLKDMAEKIVNEKVYDFSDTAILSDDFQNLIKDLKEPVIFKNNDGFIGVYPGGYIYCGQMENKKRVGKGKWYYGTIKNIIIADALWDEDKPNGPATIYSYINPKEIIREEHHTYALQTKTTTTTLTDGVFEGSSNINWTMEDGTIHDWDVTYSKGILQPVDYKGNAAFCKNCNANLLVGNGVSKIEGIE